MSNENNFLNKQKQIIGKKFQNIFEKKNLVVKQTILSNQKTGKFQSLPCRKLFEIFID